MNFHRETGIAFGYIAANELDSDLVDELIYGPQAKDLSYQDQFNEFLDAARKDAEYSDLPFDAAAAVHSFNDLYEPCEPIIAGELDGVKYCSSWLGGALHFWIFESPYAGLFQPCSPCVPGAADLGSPSKRGIEGYDVPIDWRLPNL